MKNVFLTKDVLANEMDNLLGGKNKIKIKVKIKTKDKK